MEYVLLALVALVTVTAVAMPLLRRPAPPASDDELDAEVDRYRVALRAGTVCTGCLEANAPGSRYCAGCGAALPVPEGEVVESSS